MKYYKLSTSDIRKFCCSGAQFLSFDEYINIVKWYRDTSYAPDNIQNFGSDIGAIYNVWTINSKSEYHRHIFPDEIQEPLTITFEITHLKKNSSFPILIKILDNDGIYFRHEQELAVERIQNGKSVLTSWRKVPAIREFITSEANK